MHIYPVNPRIIISLSGYDDGAMDTGCDNCTVRSIFTCLVLKAGLDIARPQNRILAEREDASNSMDTGTKISKFKAAS